MKITQTAIRLMNGSIVDGKIKSKGEAEIEKFYVCPPENSLMSKLKFGSRADSISGRKRYVWTYERIHRQ